MKLIYSIQENDPYSTVKDVLISYFRISKRLLTKLKKENAIFINGTVCMVTHPVKTLDTICLLLDQIEDNRKYLSSQNAIRYSI